MNTLSWLILLAEIADKAGGLAQAALIGGIVVTPFAMFLAAPVCDFDNNKIGPFVKKAMLLGVAWCVVFGLLFVAVPTSKTIYMIAASEAGETVVTSPESVEMMGDLKAIIKKRLKDELGEVAK